MRIIKVFTAGWLLVLGTIGCQREEEFPQAPILISPEDGGVFTDQAPVFIWQSVEEATEYIIRISKDSFTDGDFLVEDTLVDTTYAMPQNLFESTENGIYLWAVSSLSEDRDLLWSKTRTIQIERTEKTVAELLYDTYFPMDTGYEWVYERDKWRWYGLDDIWLEAVETVTVKVDSVTEMDDGWVVFHLNNSFYFDVENQLITNGNHVAIFDCQDTISTDSYRTRREDIPYNEIQRTKGIGVVTQLYSEGNDYGGIIWYDSLKNYCKADTIWRYE